MRGSETPPIEKKKPARMSRKKSKGDKRGLELGGGKELLFYRTVKAVPSGEVLPGGRNGQKGRTKKKLFSKTKRKGKKKKTRAGLPKKEPSAVLRVLG